MPELNLFQSVCVNELPLKVKDFPGKEQTCHVVTNDCDVYFMGKKRLTFLLEHYSLFNDI